MQQSDLKITKLFKFYPNIVCNSDGFLYQLQHTVNKKTRKFRKLTYNNLRKSYYINGQLVSKKRLQKLAVNP